MGFSEKASLIIYRFRERGLEVFLVNDDSEEKESWGIPEGEITAYNSQSLVEQDRLISLDPVEQDSGATEKAWAVEGDWHEIPSLKHMLYEDAVQIKNKVLKMEKGTFFNLKEAFKKVLPHQYNFLKELRDILTDRNSTKDI